MGKLELNKKQKKDAMYQTAFELFTTKGLTKTTISDIVEKAGIAKGTFYLYFKGKYDIRNKLVSRKTGELFHRARLALSDTGLEAFDDQLLFIVDYILNELEQNHPLLIFISKNLSWGMFRGILDREIQEEEDPYGSAFPDILQQAEMKYRDPELMLFSILELVGSACYSCILFQQPVPLSSYKPDLYHTIRAILSAHEYK